MSAGRLGVTTYFCQKIPSRIEQSESLTLKVRRILLANGLKRSCFPVELLVRECLANALDHGNHKNADKAIVLRLWIGREWIRLRVRDQGPGFSWQKARDSWMDVSAASGRGLQLYALYAERVQFNRRGNQVTLWIRRRD